MRQLRRIPNGGGLNMRGSPTRPMILCTFCTVLEPCWAESCHSGWFRFTIPGEEPPEIKDRGITGRSNSYRPPDSWLLRTTTDRHAALEWLRDLAPIWGAIPPLAVRADALREYFDNSLNDEALSDTSTSPSELPRLWASRANPEILAKLPELHGQVGYIVWALGELAHLYAEATSIVNRLPRYGLEHEVAIQMNRFGFDSVPARVAVALDRISPNMVTNVEAILSTGGSFEDWESSTTEFLDRLVISERSDLARLILERTSRLSIAIATACNVPDIWPRSRELWAAAEQIESFVRDMEIATLVPFIPPGSGTTGLELSSIH